MIRLILLPQHIRQSTLLSFLIQSIDLCICKYLILLAEYTCHEEPQVFDYTTPVGFTITDANGIDATDALSGSTSSFLSSAGPSGTATLTITDDQPGQNILMEIPTFTVNNAQTVEVRIVTPSGSTYPTTVSAKITQILLESSEYFPVSFNNSSSN